MSTVEEKTDETEILSPSYAVRYQTLGKDENAKVYAQKPLSFFGKMELFSLLGATIEDAMSEGNLSLSDFFVPSELSANNTDFFIRMVAQLVEYAPDFLKDLYCVALNIPKGERDLAKALMDQPEDDGGLSDDDGVDILDTFIEQNWEAVYSFFTEKIMPLVQKVLSKAQATPLSKPSSPTPRRTRKQ